MLLNWTAACFTAIAATLISSVSAISLDIDDVNSIYKAQALVAKGLMDYYNGNSSGETPGMFVYGYYWWEAGTAWGTMIDYTYYTDNNTYTDLIKSSMLYQTGSDWDYMPTNQTSTEGNDDQAFWGIAAIAAAEKNFSAPRDTEPSWIYLAQAVFNTMAWRWDAKDCQGGLRWQIFTWNAGYDYKNSVSNGCLFHLAARLARFTGNDSYTDWAEKAYNWLVDVNFLDVVNSSDSTITYVYDGAYIEKNCSDVKKSEWTYNYGLFMSGCAYMYNYTQDDVWLTRIENIWNRGKVFFKNDIMYEAACQPYNICNTDQRSFKGIYSRFLGLTMLMAPPMSDILSPYVITSAKAAALSCTGGTDGHTCGQNWFLGRWDGVYGLGEQISALDTFNTLLIHTRDPPYTINDTQTTSNGAAGGNSTSTSGTIVHPLNITTKDKAGAGVITAVVLIVLIAASWWMVM